MVMITLFSSKCCWQRWVNSRSAVDAFAILFSISRLWIIFNFVATLNTTERLVVDMSLMEKGEVSSNNY